MRSLADQILKCIAEAGQAVKARTIAQQLNVSRGEVNSLLYGQLASKVSKNEEHRWLLRTPSAPNGISTGNATVPDRGYGHKQATIPGFLKAHDLEDKWGDLTDAQRALMVRRIVEFSFSSRVQGVLRKLGVKRVGDLTQLTAERILHQKNAGKRSLAEIEKFLRDRGLSFGRRIPNWNNEAAAWEHELREQIDQARRSEALGQRAISERSDGYIEGELLAVCQEVWGSQHRNAKIVCSLLGWDGRGTKTLEEVGSAFGITRERVRQLRNGFFRRIDGKPVFVPRTLKALQFLESMSPISEAEAQRRLIAEGLCRPDFEITGLLSTQDLLKRSSGLSVHSVEGVSLIALEGAVTGAERALRFARATVSRRGCAHVEEILDVMYAEGYGKLPMGVLTLLLETQSKLRWLSPDRQWFTLDDGRRNRLINVVRKILSVSGEVAVAELRAALRRVHRLDGFVPPKGVLREFCRGLPDCQVESENVVSIPRADPQHVLGRTELTFYEVLKRNDGVMSAFELERECTARGMNGNTFFQYLTYSPIILRLARSVYALTGAQVSPGTVEALIPDRGRAATLHDHGWTKEGRPWVAYRLNRPTIRTGVFSFPAALRGLITDDYSLAGTGKAQLSRVTVKNDRMTGLKRAIAVRGGEEGDIMVVTFDLSERTAKIAIGDDELAEDLVTPSRPDLQSLRVESALVSRGSPS